jgi:hypothetical protein
MCSRNGPFWPTFFKNILCICIKKLLIHSQFLAFITVITVIIYVH